MALALLWRDKWLLLAAFTLLCHARFVVRSRSFGDPRRDCGGRTDIPVAPANVAARVGWAVEQAARLFPASTCLERAIAGQRLLAWKGFSSQIKVGLRRGSDPGFEAHAWLCTGASVIDASKADLESYQTFIGKRE